MKVKRMFSAVLSAGLLGLSIGNVQAATITLAEQGAGSVSSSAMSNITLTAGSTVTLDIWALGMPLDTIGGALDVNYDAGFVSGFSNTLNTAEWGGGGTLGTDDGGGTFGNVSVLAAPDFTGASPSGFQQLSGTDVLIGTLTFVVGTTLGNTILSLADGSVLGASGFQYFDTTTGTYAALNPTALGANITVVSAVPLPPAIWLLGSALVGLMGLSRRKQSLAKAAA